MWKFLVNSKRSQGLEAGESQASPTMSWEGFLQEAAVGVLYLSPAEFWAGGGGERESVTHQSPQALLCEYFWPAARDPLN